MALVLRFDESHDYINSIYADRIGECGDCLAVCFTESPEKTIFNNCLLLKRGRVIQTFYESSLPNKVKTFLLLGGLDYAIASTNRS